MLALVVSVLAGVSPADGAGEWSPTTLPVDAGSENVSINDVDCWSAGNCVAVGQMGVNNTSQTRQVLVQETGGTWSQVPFSSLVPVGGSPYGHLDSVSCPAAGFCVAVGRNGGDNSGSTGLVVTLQDGTWSAQAAPSVGDEYQVWLNDVSCASATTCAAVGYLSSSQGAVRGMLETYDGDGWTASQVDTPSVPGGVTVTETRLWGVSCWAPGSCVAVGRTYSNSDGYLHGLVAELDNGTWTSANAPEPGNAYADTSELRGVACSPDGRCAAQGQYGDLPRGDANDELLTRQADGGWTAVMAPRPAGSTQVELDGVSCAADGTCGVAGSSIDDNHQEIPVVFASSGTGTWSVLPVDLPPNRLGPDFAEVTGLSAISCVSATSCTGAGFYATNDLQGYAGLLVDVDPTAATTSSQEAPLPDGAYASYQDVPLTAVSCLDATHCTVTGSYVGADGNQHLGLALARGGAVEPPPPAPAPKVTDVSPSGGTRQGGTKVTITGTGFKGQVRVLFGTKAGTKVVVRSAKKLTVVSPAHKKGTVSVRVRTDAGTSAASKQARFTFR